MVLQQKANTKKNPINTGPDSLTKPIEIIIIKAIKSKIARANSILVINLVFKTYIFKISLSVYGPVLQ